MNLETRLTIHKAENFLTHIWFVHSNISTKIQNNSRKERAFITHSSYKKLFLVSRACLQKAFCKMYVTICGKILETHSKLFVVGFVVHDAVAAVDLLQEDHLHQLMGEGHSGEAKLVVGAL